MLAPASSSASRKESCISRLRVLKSLLGAKIHHCNPRLLLGQGKGGVGVEMETRHTDRTGIVRHCGLVDMGIFILEEGEDGEPGAFRPRTFSSRESHLVRFCLLALRGDEKVESLPV